MHRDPMEGTPDDVPVYQCAEHGYQADDYPCEACTERREREERELELAEAFAVELGTAQATNELMNAFHRAMDRVRESQDEAMGRAMDARWGRGR